jgi:hypothetical protein
MTTHNSAPAHEETPHETETPPVPISDALRSHAESVINDSSIDPQWRTIIRYALEIDDPWLNDLVPRAEAGEDIRDTFESVRMSLEHRLTDDQIKTLAETICEAGRESAVALFELMSDIENSAKPKAQAYLAKLVAFTRWGEMNHLDEQREREKRELLTKNSLPS